MVYARPEDEFYHKHCAWSFTCPVTSRPVRKDELQPLRLVMLLLPEQVASARHDLPATASASFALLLSTCALTCLPGLGRRELDAAVGNAAA